MSKVVKSARPQSGFGMVVAIVVLVIFAVLGAALMKIGTTQQLTSAQDVQSARAWLAAKAGTEWGLYQALQAGACGSRTLDLTPGTGFRVTVTCEASKYSEGQEPSLEPKTLTVFRITAVACNSTGNCPDNAGATATGYIERVREVIATD